MKVKEPDLTEQIREIFGTTDAKELRQIAEDAACYRKKGNSANRSPDSIKNSYTDPQLANILALQKQGVKITEIAKKYHVSRQTIYSQIKRVHNFSEDPDVKMRMYFMNRDYLCTMIDIDFLHEKIYIKNDKKLDVGTNEIEFTTLEEGEYIKSCYMNMINNFFLVFFYKE